MSKLRWINTKGSPLLLAERAHLGHWLGSYLPADEYNGAEVETPSGGYYLCIDPELAGQPLDYNRAVEIPGNVGLIKVGPSQGVVLADEAVKTTWWPIPRGWGGYLVRWVASDKERNIVTDLKRIPQDLAWQTVGMWRVHTKHLLLFDSMDLGFKPDGSALAVALRVGNYEVSALPHYGQCKGTHLSLVRILLKK